MPTGIWRTFAVAGAVFAFTSVFVDPLARDAGDAASRTDAPDASWHPTPGLATLTRVATDAQVLMADGVPQAAAFQRATESHGLVYQQGLEPLAGWFTAEEIEQCAYAYWFLTDSFVNACDPWRDLLAAGGGPAGPGLLADRLVMLWGSWYSTDYRPAIGNFLPDHPAILISIGDAFCASFPCLPPPGDDTIHGSLQWDPNTREFHLEIQRTNGGAQALYDGIGGPVFCPSHPYCGGDFSTVALGGILYTATDGHDDLSLAHGIPLDGGTAAWSVVVNN